MFKRIYQLFKIARKLASSGAIETVNQIYKIPTIINIFFEIISIGSQKKFINNKKQPGEKLCDALEGMGTTFIKLGQFLATRPDIIGEELTNDLIKLQDKLPAFDMYQAKKIIKKELGENQYEKIVNLSEPIAAASIAQVHIATIKINNEDKEVAIKILRPDIEKQFNEELDALMLFAYIIESSISKAKNNGLDLGIDFVCKNYHNLSHHDAYSLYQVTDKLNSIFLSESTTINFIRKSGFSLINKTKKIKKQITNYAMGV